MATFVAMYSKPDDVEGFEQHYREVHVPIAQRWPGVRATRGTRLVSTPRGGEPAYHLLFEADFDSDEEMAAALRSEAGAEAARDARDMVERFGVEVTMALGQPF